MFCKGVVHHGQQSSQLWQLECVAACSHLRGPGSRHRKEYIMPNAKPSEIHSSWAPLLEGFATFLDSLGANIHAHEPVGMFYMLNYNTM